MDGDAGQSMTRRTWPNGPHLLEFEPPDLFHCYVHGDVQVSEINAAIRVMREEVIPNVPVIYFVVHQEMGVGALPKETRQHLRTVAVPARGTVVVGGMSAMMRMGLNVIAQSIMAISRKKILMKVVGTRQEALACVAEWRSTSA